MPAIILPDKWRRQPQGSLSVDWANDLARGLELLFIPSLGSVNLAKSSPGSGLWTNSIRQDGVTGIGNTANSFSFDVGSVDASKPVSVFTRGTILDINPRRVCGTSAVSFQHAGAPGATLQATYLGVADYNATSDVDLYNGAYGSAFYSTGCTITPATTGGLLFYGKGRQVGNAVNTGTPTSGANKVYLFAQNTANRTNNYAASIIAVWNRALSAIEHESLDANPWQLVRKPGRMYFLPSAGGGATATGDLSQTLGAVTSSSAGTVDVQGALSKTLSTLSLSSTGTVDVQGALSQTLSTLTLSSTGTVDVTGTLAVTLGTLTPSASGTVSSGPIGDLTVTLANVAISSTGTVDVTGALSNTLATLTTAATGTVEVVGSSTNTLGALSISAAGTVGTTVSTGDLSKTLATLTASSTGTVSVSGTLSTTMGNLTLVAYDVEPVSSRPGTIMGGRRVVKEIDALFRAREEQALAALKRADDELLMIIALAA